MDSYGVSGDVLECGSFRGFSSSCLSMATAYLGRRKLIIADSFNGLPDIGQSGYYKPGMFTCSLNEVKDNIRSFGNLDYVEFIEGWYKESLAGFSKKLCIIWLDVDLSQSALDVLVNTFSMLSPKGIIMFHESSPDTFLNGQIKKTNNTPEGVRLFLQQQGISYSGKFLSGYTSVVVPNTNYDEKVIYNPARFDSLLTLLIPNEWKKAFCRKMIADVQQLPIISQFIEWIFPKIGLKDSFEMVHRNPKI